MPRIVGAFFVLGCQLAWGYGMQGPHGGQGAHHLGGIAVFRKSDICGGCAVIGGFPLSSAMPSQ